MTRHILPREEESTASRNMILLMLTYMLNLEEPPRSTHAVSIINQPKSTALAADVSSFAPPRSAQDGPMDDGLGFPGTTQDELTRREMAWKTAKVQHASVLVLPVKPPHG